MSWADGADTIICELCGHANKPEESKWFQAEIIICKDTAACSERQKAHLWDNVKDKLAKGD